MSDPVTNVEIEDVLSSIRRLVSEGEKLRDTSAPSTGKKDRPAEAGQEVLELGSEDRADEVEKQSEGPVRFVLTSAYRVDQEDERAAEAPAVPDSTGPAPTDAQAVTGEEAVPEEAPTAEAPAEDTSVEEEPDAAADAPATGEILWDDEETTVASPDDTSAIVEPGEAIPDWVARGNAELDALEADDGPADLSADDPGLEDDVLEPEGPMFEPGLPEDDPAPAMAAEPRSLDRSTLESTIAELEAAIADTAEEWEPDGSEDMPVMDWDNAPEAGMFFSSRFASGGPVEEAEVAADDEDESDEVAEKFEAAEAFYAEGDIEEPEDPLNEKLTAYLEQDDVLDEETLREMVAEIVRQELQGPLGERITRNVRKLVRREIYRALAEQGFE